MPEVLSPSDLELLHEDDDVVLQELVHQVNLKLRRHYRSGAPVYVRLDPWPHDRLVNRLLEMASEHWRVEVETGWRFAPYVLRFEELPPEPDPEQSSYRHRRMPVSSPGR